jgi:hypothetical protein
MRLAGLTIAIALGWAASAACTLELDRAIACGDGYVDHLAGEECDPLVESSYENACLQHPSKHEGVGGCNPRTCQFDFTQCALCGDGRIDPGEECDGNDFDGEMCPIDKPGLRCTSDCRLDYSACPTCGNGIRDEGEECDPKDVGGIVTPRPCAGDDDFPPLSTPHVEEPFARYTRGTTNRCNEDCTFDRSHCTYCGNDRRDDEILVDRDRQLSSFAEVCDGTRFTDSLLMAEFGQSCFAMEGDLRPNVGCADNCLQFTPLRDDRLCCAKGGSPCPQTDAVECCFAYDYPGEEACETQFDTMGFAQEVCRHPKPLAPP